MHFFIITNLSGAGSLHIFIKNKNSHTLVVPPESSRQRKNNTIVDKKFLHRVTLVLVFDLSKGNPWISLVIQPIVQKALKLIRIRKVIWCFFLHKNYVLVSLHTNIINVARKTVFL